MKVILSQDEIVKACRTYVEEALTDSDFGELTHSWLFDGDEPDMVQMCFEVVETPVVSP